MDFAFILNGQWVSGFKKKYIYILLYHTRVGWIYSNGIRTTPETRKHSQYKTTGTRSLAWHTCCRCFCFWCCRTLCICTSIYVFSCSLINRPNGRRWARTPFPVTASLLSHRTLMSIRRSIAVHLTSLSHIHIQYTQALFPFQKTFAFFIVFYIYFFFSRNDLSSDRNKTRHVRPPRPKGLKRDRGFEYHPL